MNRLNLFLILLLLFSANFTSADEIMIKIISPKAGELWLANEEKEIKWETETPSSQIKTVLSLSASGQSFKIGSIEGKEVKSYLWKVPLLELPWDAQPKIKVKIFNQKTKELLAQGESGRFLYLGKHIRIVLNYPQTFFRYEGRRLISKWLCSASSKRHGSYDFGVNYAGRKKFKARYKDPETGKHSWMYWFIKIVPTDPLKYERVKRRGFNGIHQAYSYRERRLGRGQSHGCINISRKVAKENYDWAYEKMPIFIMWKESEIKELLKELKMRSLKTSVF